MTRENNLILFKLNFANYANVHEISLQRVSLLTNTTRMSTVPTEACSCESREYDDRYSDKVRFDMNCNYRQSTKQTATRYKVRIVFQTFKETFLKCFLEKVLIFSRGQRGREQSVCALNDVILYCTG